MPYLLSTLINSNQIAPPNFLTEIQIPNNLHHTIRIDYLDAIHCCLDYNADHVFCCFDEIVFFYVVDVLVADCLPVEEFDVAFGDF